MQCHSLNRDLPQEAERFTCRNLRFLFCSRRARWGGVTVTPLRWHLHLGSRCVCHCMTFDITQCLCYIVFSIFFFGLCIFCSFLITFSKVNIEHNNRLTAQLPTKTKVFSSVSAHPVTFLVFVGNCVVNLLMSYHLAKTTTLLKCKKVGVLIGADWPMSSRVRMSYSEALISAPCTSLSYWNVCVTFTMCTGRSIVEENRH